MSAATGSETPEPIQSRGLITPTTAVAAALSPDSDRLLFLGRAAQWLEDIRRRCFCSGTYLWCLSLLTPVYEATATVDIDMRTPMGVLGTDSRQASSPDADQFMATQMKLIQSDSVLRPVAEKYHLLDLERQYPDTPNLQAVLDNAPIKLKKLRVNRPPNTFLIQIAYRSPDRNLSSSVANEIATAYIKHTYQLRLQSLAGRLRFHGEATGRTESTDGEIERQTRRVRARPECCRS